MVSIQSSVNRSVRAIPVRHVKHRRRSRTAAPTPKRTMRGSSPLLNSLRKARPGLLSPSGDRGRRTQGLRAGVLDHEDAHELRPPADFADPDHLVHFHAERAAVALEALGVAPRLAHRLVPVGGGALVARGDLEGAVGAQLSRHDVIVADFHRALLLSFPPRSAAPATLPTRS